MSIVPRRAGFALIELIGVMVLIVVIGTAMTLLLRHTLQAERLQAEGLERMLKTRTMADLFRADVSRAAKAPARWEGYKADAATLILQMPGGEHILYQWHKGKLSRRVVGKEEPEQTLLVGDRLRVEFTRDSDSPRLLRARILTLGEGTAPPVQTLEIAAAVGGDWR